MSKIEVDQVDPQSGTTLTLGTSGDTIVVPSGVTFNSSAATNTLPSSVVTTTGTQTLTNKSIVATQLTGTISTAQIADDAVTYAKMQDTSTNNRVLGAASAGTIGEVQIATDMIANDAVTLAKMASGTDGNIISYDASGNPVAVATGSAGQVLTSAGAGQPPAFAAATGGANTPYFFAYRNSAFTTNTETLTTIIFDAEDLDSGSGFNTSTGAYTIPSGQGGKYLLTYSVTNDTVSAGVVEAFSQIKRTGSATTIIGRAESDQTGNFQKGVTLNNSVILNCVAGDVIIVQYYQQTESGSPGNIVVGTNRATFFSGFKLIE